LDASLIEVSDSDHLDAIFIHLASEGEITTAEAMKLLGCSPATARRVLVRLADDGLVTAIGGNRNRKYKLNPI